MQRVRANLHCLLVMTPGPAWQDRLQRFPALAAHAQLQHVPPLSAASLQEIAGDAVAALQPGLAPDEAARLATLCAQLHVSARQAADWSEAGSKCRCAMTLDGRTCPECCIWRGRCAVTHRQLVRRLITCSTAYLAALAEAAMASGWPPSWLVPGSQPSM